MFYWIVIVFAIATMLGLNLSKKDDYKDAVLMPKIEPIISRAITQHRAANDYFNDSYEERASGNLSQKVLKVGVVIPNAKLGRNQLQNFAPHGFMFFDTDINGVTYNDNLTDPVTRIICAERASGAPTNCDNAIFRNVLLPLSPANPAKIAYLVTYMPIPVLWDTPYYHNMIVNQIKRLSDNSFSYGIVKAVPAVDATNYNNARNNTNIHNTYSAGIPLGSTRAIYTVVEEFDSSGRNNSGNSLTDGSRRFVPVYNYVPGVIARLAKFDFPSRGCGLGTASDRRDINGMLLFFQKLTDLDGEIGDVNAGNIFIPSLNNEFCPYNGSDEDIILNSPRTNL
ncbi:MAG: hypothetical protein BWY78_00327 [Alphaproteobacteria bacterium ADurb.Bin438]|nr:MAG: hypothetical protein BWY78_00327 [Alphaproteobacteria bacterium ADurb.Bin438]